jgi:hypothetical protein
MLIDDSSMATFVSQTAATKTRTFTQIFLIHTTAAANTPTVRIVTLPSVGRPTEVASE